MNPQMQFKTENSNVMNQIEFPQTYFKWIIIIGKYDRQCKAWKQ